jgi:hypothetical protein
MKKWWETKKYKRLLEVEEHSLDYPEIQFLTDQEEYIDLCPVKPASEFSEPAWYRNLQREWTEMRDGKNGNYHDKTWNKIPYYENSLKKCPTVSDQLNLGYIIPLWVDLKIDHTQAKGFSWYNKHAFDDTIEHITSHDPKSIGSMPIPENSYFTALKFTNPWDIITPPGWSVIITQPWYHRNLEIEILPSIVETDSYHQMNIPFLYHGRGTKTFRQGMPLIQVIPFKREEIPNYLVSTRNKEQQIYYNKSRAAERTKFHGWYRWLTKTNKKRWKEQGII